jgi:hypothetical protein
MDGMALFPKQERFWDQRVHLPDAGARLILDAVARSPVITNARDVHEASSPLMPILAQSALSCNVIEQHLSLVEKRTLACVSHSFYDAMRRSFDSLQKLKLCRTEVQMESAAFIALRLPSLRYIILGSECSGTELIEIAQIRRGSSVRRLPPHLSSEAALLFGAAIVQSNADTILVSDGRRICLNALRHSTCVRLRGMRGTQGLTDADLASLLCSLHLNRSLREVDLCANPAPSSMTVLRALHEALPHTKIRHHRSLALGRTIRAAVQLPCNRLLPSWLETHAADDDGDYVQNLCLSDHMLSQPRCDCSQFDVMRLGIGVRSSH